ncbi:MAG TPA: hypothetical protein VK470_18315, partial [Bacteroidota bacterium]|nr:hypothetical protein [Bacteroidota bacterium]
MDIEKWDNVNLLLSWERQGYYWNSGNSCLTQKFVIPANKDKDLSLSLSLQCDVKSIYINGRYIGGNLPSQFWSDKRGVATMYTIPHDMLHRTGENIISIDASNFSYTGGKSYNSCILTPVKADGSSALKITVPAKDHLFSIEDKNASITLEYNAREKGSIELMIVSDFHDTLVCKTFSVPPGGGTIPFNFTNEITQP